VVAVTEPGLRVLGVVNGRLERLGETLLADLTAADRRALHRVLATLATGPAVTAAVDAVRVRPSVPRPAPER
jgi:hypothetical protein